MLKGLPATVLLAVVVMLKCVVVGVEDVDVPTRSATILLAIGVPRPVTRSYPAPAA